MLKYCESFDHEAASAIEALGWTFPSGTNLANQVLIQPGLGRWGTSRIDFVNNPWGWYSRKSINLTRSATRLVVGFAFTRTTHGYYGPSEYMTGNVLWFNFAYGTFENFSIGMTLSATGLTFIFKTGAYNKSGYPNIPSSNLVSVPFVQSNNFTFVEFYVDCADYKNGTVKVAVNGRTVYTGTGIVTAEYTGFGDNPNDARAKLNSFAFGTTYGQYNFLCLDSIYVCDDDGGYHNDFLGDIFVKTVYPVGDGDKIDWSLYINGLAAPESAPRVTLIDDPVFDPAIEPDYIQADQDLSQETMSFGTALIPVDSTLIAVNQRTAARSVASPGTPPANSLIPLFKSSGNDIIVGNSRAKKFTGWTYQFLDVYWNLVEGLAVDWTELLLDESQFGFMLRESIWTGVILEELGFADEVVDT